MKTKFELAFESALQLASVRSFEKHPDDVVKRIDLAIMYLVVGLEHDYPHITDVLGRIAGLQSHAEYMAFLDAAIQKNKNAEVAA